MQSRIAQTVSQVLTAQATGAGFSQGEDRFSSSGGTSNAEAFDAYLQGFAAFDRGRVADNYLAEYAKSLPYFDRAISLDPNYAAAFAGRSRYFTRVGQITDDKALLRRGFDDAQKCIDLAPDFADGYAVMGFTWIFYKFNVSGSDKYYQRARELGWGDVKALMGYQGYCAGWWKLKEAEEAIQRMIALDPLSFPVQMRLIELRVEQDRNDEALEIIDRHLAEGKNNNALNFWAVMAHIGKKEFGLARAKTEKFSDEYDKEVTFAEIALAEGAGREFEKRSINIIDRFGKDPDLKNAVTYLKSIYLAHIDETEAAISLLEEQYRIHNSYVLQIRSVDTLEEKLGEHPRYIALYKKMGLTGKPPKTM
jgi:serine/threonine-protein kinase